MRNTFFEYNMRGNKKIEQILSNGLIILDTNALLNLYRYNEENKNKFFEILSKVSDRIYLTNYSVKEFYKNRSEILYNKAHFKEEMKKTVCEDIKKLRNIIKNVNFNGKFKNSCCLLKYESDLKSQMLKDIDCFTSSIENTIDSYNQSNLITDLGETDPILDKILDLFDGKVNQKFSENELVEIYKEGQERYKSKTPPGYKDENDKDEPDCYGDLVIWKEMINISKEKGTDILFVSDDRKEDWCDNFKGENVGTRKDLIREFFCETGKLFYSFTVAGFIKEISEVCDVTGINELEKESELFGSILSETVKETHSNLRQVGIPLSTTIRALKDIQTKLPESAIKQIKDAQMGTPINAMRQNTDLKKTMRLLSKGHK
ncbi:DUF4935 domain-containing protein [Clostridioides difficile]|nr:DUF4935 domain-containing protein [Clostridioides difficile]MDB9655776.1 PIN-like domain-containing protein [Clostridioides difficile]MDE3402342.1 PIN-like domain-containing protein [Clostridioides difficile]MDN9069264.1 DUF4935 domain-containing protein [Clostridioides difficile]MDV9365915.1 PIN-like domain-containing protein [Clostridioides difficile]